MKGENKVMKDVEIMPAWVKGGVCVRMLQTCSDVSRHRGADGDCDVEKTKYAESPWARRILGISNPMGKKARHFMSETCISENRRLRQELGLSDAIVQDTVLAALASRVKSKTAYDQTAKNQAEKDSKISDEARTDNSGDGYEASKESEVSPSAVIDIDSLRAEVKRIVSAERGAPQTIRSLVGFMNKRDAFRERCVVISDVCPPNDSDFMLLLCQTYFEGQDASPTSASIFVREILLPPIRRLQRPASRSLYCAVVAAVKTHVDAVVSSLIIPLLSPGGAGSGRAQGELVKRIVREHMSAENVLDLLERAAAAGWTEVTVAVVQAILSTKPTLSSALGQSLVSRFDVESQSSQLSKSLVFAASVHTLIKNYGSLAVSRAATLRLVLGRCKAFMASVALKALERAVKEAL
eukprot:g1358.t1